MAVGMEFTIIRRLGSGTFGNVYLARASPAGEEFAIKRVRVSSDAGAEDEYDDDADVEISREVRINAMLVAAGGESHVRIPHATLRTFAKANKKRVFAAGGH